MANIKKPFAYEQGERPDGNMKRCTILALALLAFCMSTLALGCTPGHKAVIDDHAGGKNGITRTYKTDADTAFLAVSTVFKKWNHADGYREHKEELYVIGRVGMESGTKKYTKIFFLGAFASATMVAHGVICGAWVKPVEGGVDVDIVMAEPEMGLDSLVREEDLHQQIAAAIAIASSGRPLPEDMPAEFMPQK